MVVAGLSSHTLIIHGHSLRVNINMRQVSTTSCGALAVTTAPSLKRCRSNTKFSPHGPERVLDPRNQAGRNPAIFEPRIVRGFLNFVFIFWIAWQAWRTHTTIIVFLSCYPFPILGQLLMHALKLTGIRDMWRLSTPRSLEYIPNYLPLPEL